MEERAGARRSNCYRLKSPHPNPLPAQAGRGRRGSRTGPWISTGLFVFVAVLWLVPDRRIERVLTKRDKADSVLIAVEN